MARPRDTEKAAKMYELYQSGQSLEQVGATFTMSRQSVYEKFRLRGWPMRPKKYLPAIEFEGASYTLDPKGYYRETTGRGPGQRWLHREVWRKHFGRIPPRHDIHHRDHDRSNNDPENLECLTPEEHSKHHQRYTETPEQYCLECGRRLQRKDVWVRGRPALEVPAALRRRKYCDTACHANAMRGRPRGVA